MKKFILALMGVVIIAGVLYFLNCHCGNRVQAKLNHKMSALIASSTDFSDARFVLNGSDVTLTGRVHSEAIKADLEAKANALSGVRSLSNALVVDRKLTIPTPVAPPVALGAPVQDINFVLGKNNSTITLDGVVADQAEVDALLAVFDGDDVTNNLSIARNLPEDWAGQSLGVANLSKKFARLQLGVAGREVSFKGDIHANERADLIQLQLRQLFPNANITSDIAMAGLDASVRGCQSAIKAILDANAIQFGVGSATLKPKGRTVIEQVVTAGGQCDGIRYNISGHTDNTGSAEGNQNLSQRRASAVAKFMMELGIAQTNLHAKGYGSSRPIAGNDTELGRQLNRRIDIWVK